MKRTEELRNHRWFGMSDLRSFGHRSRLKQMGYDRDDFASKPFIVNTLSDINPCPAHARRGREARRMPGRRLLASDVGAVALRALPGPLAHVLSGDMIEVDVGARRLHLDMPEEELARRRTGWIKPPERPSLGCGALYAARVGQVSEGCDFDFLLPGPRLPEPEIH